MPRQTDKKQVAVRIPLREKAELEREAVDRGVSRSEYIRSILRDRHRIGELEQQLAVREDRIEDLERQLARRSQVEEKIDTLAKRTEQSEAPFFVRWYNWWKQK